MKFKIILMISIALSLTACDNAKENEKNTPYYIQQLKKKSKPELFQEMDHLNIAIENMLNFASGHPVEVQKQIVCISYPILYKQLYMPVTLEYAQRAGFKDTTQESLLNDFNSVQQSYITSLQISC